MRSCAWESFDEYDFVNLEQWIDQLSNLALHVATEFPDVWLPVRHHEHDQPIRPAVWRLDCNRSNFRYAWDTIEGRLKIS